MQIVQSELHITMNCIIVILCSTNYLFGTAGQNNMSCLNEINFQDRKYDVLSRFILRVPKAP